MSKSIHKVLEEGIQTLRDAGKEEAVLDARLLLEATLACDRMYLLLNKEKALSQNERQAYETMIKERAQGKPLQHILKQQEFMGLKFQVTPFTLVPRRETEELVEFALKHLSKEALSWIMDIGTGTGCIPISLTVLNKKVSALGIDLSPEALAVAEQNSLAHGVNNRITWVKSDLCGNIGPEWYGKMDMIVSNPPYIKTEDIQGLSPEVRIFEPLMALDGGRDGLDFYRRISCVAKPFLKEGGIIIFEIGYNQGEEVCDLLRANDFKQVTCKKDLLGEDRMVFGLK